MTIEDVKASIRAAIEKRDLLCETSPANSMLLSKYYGSYQAILSGNGQEKYLVPELGTVHFLYRGQNKESVPCLPTLYRGEPDDIAVFENRLKLTVFKRLLDSHPVVGKFFKRHHFVINYEGLAQHYGLRTEILDLTSSLDVAIFFAVTRYDAVTDSYGYFTEGVHTGVLYVFDPIFDNESGPSHFDKYLTDKIQPIGLQAFPRPGVQCGYGLRLPKDTSTRSWMFEFEFTAEESKHYYDKFSEGKSLWVKDCLVEKTRQIGEMKDFSYNLFNETFDTYRPAGWSKSRMKSALRDAHLHTRVPDFVFNDVEAKDIVEEWNDHLGREMAANILRKPWFTYDRMEKNAEGKDCIVGKHHEMDFQTMKHLGESVMLMFVESPDGPEGAVWKDYASEPVRNRHIPPKNGEWQKIDASMTNVFGKPYLREEEWRICPDALNYNN